MRFSQIYLERGEPTKDSIRLRVRVASAYGNFSRRPVCRQLNFALAQYIEIELGVDVPRHYNGYDLDEFFRHAAPRDFLDGITGVCKLLPTASMKLEWREFVARAMHEENVGYRVDDQCVVHYHVDQEFERNRAATVAVLAGSAMAGAAKAHDDAYRHLDGDPQDTKAAVRSAFECMEILAKTIVPGANNLNAWQCRKGDLRAACCGTIVEPTELKATEGLFDSLAEWVDAVHNYRHGQTGEEPVAPSEELAIYLLSTGSAHARLLAQFASKLELA